MEGIWGTQGIVHGETRRSGPQAAIKLTVSRKSLPAEASSQSIQLHLAFITLLRLLQRFLITDEEFVISRDRVCAVRCVLTNRHFSALAPAHLSSSGRIANDPMTRFCGMSFCIL